MLPKPITLHRSILRWTRILNWTSTIAPTEGFSQGCPFSPIFTAIVRNEIFLTQLQDILNILASQGLEIGLKGNNNRWTQGFILACIDNCNSLVALQDVEPALLDKIFKELAKPLGAIMNNTKKTRILTSTNQTSIIDTLLASNQLEFSDGDHTLPATHRTTTWLSLRYTYWTTNTVLLRKTHLPPRQR